MLGYCVNFCSICEQLKKEKAVYNCNYIVKDKTGIIGGLNTSNSINFYDYVEFNGQIRRVTSTTNFLHTADGRKIPVIELGDPIADTRS